MVLASLEKKIDHAELKRIVRKAVREVRKQENVYLNWNQHLDHLRHGNCFSSDCGDSRRERNTRGSRLIEGLVRWQVKSDARQQRARNQEGRRLRRENNEL